MKIVFMKKSNSAVQYEFRGLDLLGRTRIRGTAWKSADRLEIPRSAEISGPYSWSRLPACLY